MDGVHEHLAVFIRLRFQLHFSLLLLARSGIKLGLREVFGFLGVSALLKRVFARTWHRVTFACVFNYLFVAVLLQPATYGVTEDRWQFKVLLSGLDLAPLPKLNLPRSASVAGRYSCRRPTAWLAGRTHLLTFQTGSDKNRKPRRVWESPAWASQLKPISF